MRISENMRIVAAHVRDGEDVPLAALPAAVPHFLLGLTVVGIERRELSVLREFVLRTILLNLNHPLDIAGFLGVKSAELIQELSDLVDELFIVRDKNGSTYRLLEKGERAISVYGLTKAVVREATCVVNGVTRSVELKSTYLISKKKLQRGGLVLPAIPARAPKVDEIEVSAVKTTIGMARAALPRVFEVARLGRIIRTTTLFLPGYLLVRRGARSVPTVVLNGSEDEAIAQRLSSHPALQTLRGESEAHELYVKRSLTAMWSGLRGSGYMHAQARNAISRLVAVADANDTAKATLKKEFIQATQQLVQIPHWICDVEAQAVFFYALIAAKSTVTIAAPATSSALFNRITLDAIGDAVQRGVKVELHLQPNDFRFSNGGKPDPILANGVELVPMNNTKGWCGFSCDNAFALVGMSKMIKVSMGEFEGFFGAIVVGTGVAKEFENFVLTKVANVFVKKRRRVAARRSS